MIPMPLPTSVWLVGLSGAGKSTVGPVVAETLGYDFVDLDDQIEANEGCSISEMFREGGEQRFRQAEAQASKTVLDRARLVVAAGGGWMARTDIRREATGCVRVWLRVSPVAAFERLAHSDDSRPLLAGTDPAAALNELLRLRERAYGAAELVVDTTNRDPSAVAGLVVERLKEWGRTHGERAGS